MKKVFSKKREKGIAARKTSNKREWSIPYQPIGIAIFLWLLTTWIFFGHGSTLNITETLGETAGSTIIARMEFQCENLENTALERAERQKSVSPVFSINPAPQQELCENTAKQFLHLEQYYSVPEEKRAEQLQTLKIGLPKDIQPQEFITAFPSNTVTKIKEQLLNELPVIMETGILADDDRARLSSPTISIKGRNRNEKLDTIHTAQSALEASIAPYKNPQQHALLEKLIRPKIKVNLAYDTEATDAKKRTTAAQVDPSMQTIEIGDVLIRKGEEVSEQSELLLKTHAQLMEQNQDHMEQLRELTANALLLFIGLTISTAMIRIANPKVLRKLDKLLLFIVLSIFVIGASRLISYLSVSRAILPPSTIMYMIPQGLPIMLATILLGARIALCLGFWNSFAIAILLGHSFSAFILGTVITITAATATRNIHRRASLFRAGLWICMAKTLYLLLAALLESQHFSVIIRQLAAALSAGTLSTVLTLLLIPLFEKLFKITTDITLLELSDMGHPLLQKMAMQAPGTYHHSLMVATLSQTAAEAIGANGLLTRVCAYYHDIGKMAKPEFFTENIQHRENPHDELSPHMSALVISSHVKEGLAIARRYKLPQPILEAIEQHHGNGLIAYFYHKAKQAREDGETINESDFRYGGDPAVSPEMTILALADSSEAASRSIEKPTPQKIANLIDDIFAAKIRDGQLDYANLTMAQIKIVKQSFVFSLTNMLHGRIPYPKDHDNKRSKPSKPSASDSKSK